MLSCFISRRRIGSYLDGALEGRAAEVTARHLEACLRCRGEADGLRRLQGLLRGAFEVPSDPDWTGFWQGIVRGIEDGQRRTPVLAPRSGWTPRLAIGGAVAAAVAVSLTLGQTVWIAHEPIDPVVVSSADTEYPGGTMVYATPDRQVTVVWVFDE